MSDAIIGRSESGPALSSCAAPYPIGSNACTVDEMGHRIDELENSIGELMAQAGIDEEPAAEGAVVASSAAPAS